jgi:hypothetical protein
MQRIGALNRLDCAMIRRDGPAYCSATCETKARKSERSYMGGVNAMGIGFTFLNGHLEQRIAKDRIMGCGDRCSCAGNGDATPALRPKFL